jgi:hypothetical protein
MYRISVYQEGQQPINFFCDEEMTDEIKSKFQILFTSSKIVSITAKYNGEESMFIFRPSKVVSLEIKELKEEPLKEIFPTEEVIIYKDNSYVTIEKEDNKAQTEQAKKQEEEVDIIKD